VIFFYNSVCEAGIDGAVRPGSTSKKGAAGAQAQKEKTQAAAICVFIQKK
jgi:hypothetical protein